jgi:formylglycine-generating enzyme required for sulfatase activity
MNEDNENDEDEEQFDPRELIEFYFRASANAEYIVELDFDHGGVKNSGHQILSIAGLRRLIAGLRSGARVRARNLPDGREEEFEIGRLEGAFSIYSEDPGDIAAMRSVFGEQVGQTGYFADVIEAAPTTIDLAMVEAGGDLFLMTSITDEAAELLSKQHGNLRLNGLTELSDAAAESLSKHRGDELHLNGLTELSNAAAESLSKLRGFSLRLGSLTELSDAAVESLSKYEGDLRLSSLKQLSDAAAESLSKQVGHLALSSLETLSDAAAESLARRQGSLYLESLAELSDAAAESISRSKGYFYLSGLTHLSDAAAESFAKSQAEIFFTGLKHLSDSAAASLSNYWGGRFRQLELCGLRELSDAAAESLATFQGEIDLRGLSELSDAAAESLAKHQGDLYLGGLKQLSDAAAESLAKHQGALDLGGLKQLSDAAAESLAKHQGDLALYDLKQLSDAAAESLAKHQGALVLGDLKQLSDAAAESLAKHQGALALGSLETLSDAAAESLAKHQGDLALGSLETLSDAAAESLAKHQAVLSLFRLETISARGARFLLKPNVNVGSSLNLGAIANSGGEDDSWDGPFCLPGPQFVIKTFGRGSFSNPVNSETCPSTTDPQMDAEASLPLTQNLREIEWVWCPPGIFRMGSPEDEPDRSPNETPHQVTLTNGFWIGKHPVTQDQWQQVMGFNPSCHPQSGPDAPVENVTWDDAREFCRALGRRDGREYRLPTEAEWEYACRAGSAGAWCFGDEMAVFGDYGCFAKNSGGRTSPVGQRKPNAWGIHDMHGNIWEWCQDCYETYASNPATDPSGPGEGSYRVYRGGGWGDPAGFCRSAVRGFYVPAFRFDGLGFRLAMSSPS